ncbi:MAG: DUF4394 domain-containing protein [Chitinophagaceae bacterium]
MKKLSLAVKIGAFGIFSLVFAACQKDKTPMNPGPYVTFYALKGNMLDKFSTLNPEKMMGYSTISGLQSGERILGIDFRPATGELFGLGSNSRLYKINPSSGMATLVAALTTVPMGSTTPVALSLSGTSFGFDFNPVVDRIRIVSNTGQNLRANPITGVTLVDGMINPTSPLINGVAYDNNDTDSTTTTELYALDVTGRQLFEIDPPNNGTLIEPLPINLKITGEGGFDIAPRNANVTMDMGLGLYEVDGKSTLFSIDVETGMTKVLAKYGKDAMYTGIAISPVIEK